LLRAAARDPESIPVKHMSLLSKLKEAVICLKAGRVTLPYPATPLFTSENFRGRPIFDPEKCIGCGGCASNCPAREILIFDPSQECRIIKYLGRRCTYCGRCADVCPEQAITLSKDFENATNSIGDMGQELKIFMGTCQRCGRCFKEPSHLEKLKMQGYRLDDLEGERWVYLSTSYLTTEPAVRDVEIELD
jgi:hydrogenase-4 component H